MKPARQLTRLLSPRLLVLPGLLVVLVFFVYPVLHLVATSFTDPSLGLENYRRAFSDPTTVRILVRTFVVAAIVTVVTLVLAYPYAYLMTMVGRRTRALLLGFVLLPFWTSLLARTFAWIILMQPHGIMARLLSAVGLGGIPLLGSQVGVTIAMCQVLLPFMVLPLYSTMNGIDRRLLNAAHSMGASRWTAFREVYLPLSLPGVVAGSILVFILSLGFWVTPRLIGSPQQSLIGQLIEVQVGQLLDFPAAGTAAVLLLVVTGVLLAAARGALQLVSSSAMQDGGTDDE